MRANADALRVWHTERVRAIYPPDVAIMLERDRDDWLSKNNIEDEQ